MNTDIEEMMYGFGDQFPLDPDAVSLMESLVVEYIGDLVERVFNLFNSTLNLKT